MNNQNTKSENQKKSAGQFRQQADPARLAAFQVLLSVYSSQAYSNLSSMQLLSDRQLNARDRAFASAMIYGTISRTISIDWLLQKVSTRSLDKLDIAVLTVLRLGTYQLYWSRSVPESAAVNESVKLVRQIRQSQAAGFVNAVLRTLIREKPILPDNKPPVFYGLPPALYGYLKKWYGREAPALAASFLEEKKQISLRVNCCQTTPEAVKKSLSEQGYQIEAGLYCAEALRLELAGTAVDKISGWQNGEFMIQDEAAMLTALACDPQPGQIIYDLCAAPGGKSAHIAEKTNREAKQTALDMNISRLHLMQDNFKRLGHTNICCLQGDATGSTKITRSTDKTVTTDVTSSEEAGSFAFAQLEQASADLVLLDAPCSGLGLLARKPELRLTMTHEKMIALYPMQQKMLDYAASLVKPGGILVYSTCTINPDENINQVRAFLSRQQEQFDFDPISSIMPEKLLVDETLSAQAAEGWLQLLPHRHNTDGFFIARLRKTKDN